MILSSADILRVLGGSEIIRLAARLKIVDEKPVLSGDEYLYVCISRFPSLDEFEATWTLWVEGDGEEELVVKEIARLLPSVKTRAGLITELTTTDFRSEYTQVAPAAPKPAKQVDGNIFEERFQELAESIQDQMLLVNSGQDGANGINGRDGVDGRDGKDLLATDADLFDLNDAEQGIQMERGQVLTWDGSRWTNLFVPQVLSSGGGGGGSNSGSSGGGIEEAPTDGRRYVRESAAWSALTPSDSGQGGIEEAPLDGNYYVRSGGKWLNMVSVLEDLGYNRSDVLDGGDFTNDTTDAADNALIDGGDFS